MKFHVVLMLALIFGYEAFSQKVDTVEWTTSFGGNKAGFLKQWTNTDGSITEWNQFHDRGRGDSTRSTYKLSDQGFIIQMNAAGNDYYKKPVHETFRINNGTAYWENNSEKGEKKISGKADYVPLHIPAGTAYKKYFSTGNTIQHLPAGSSTLSVLKEHAMKDGTRIRLVSIKGIDFTPTYTWIDSKDEFFATVSGWVSIIRKGYESEAHDLVVMQDRESSGYFKGLTSTIEKDITSGLAITHARLFDSSTGKVTENATILVRNGKITDVKVIEIAVPSAYEIIDAKGKFVMPGLWDMHVHYTDASQGLQHLSCGVTNVRDMGNAITLKDAKKEIDDGIVIGPRIQVMSGFIDRDGPFAGPTGERIKSVEEGLKAINKYHDLGYKHIKLYSSIVPEWVKPLAAEAHRLGMRVSGHIPSHMLAEEAIDAGYDEIQHANMLFLNFYGKELDTRTPARFTTVAQKAASFDFQSTEFKHFITRLKEKHIVVDPTLTVFEIMFTGKSGQQHPATASIASKLPLAVQRQQTTGPGLSVPKGMEDTYQNSFASMLKMVRLLYDNKIIIVPGTDGPAGITLHRELVNYVKAGIPAAEVLKIATLQSASVAGKTTDYGSIARGKAADIIIINGDPIRDMNDLSKIEIVIKDNKLYNVKDIDQALSIRYFE